VILTNTLCPAVLGGDPVKRAQMVGWMMALSSAFRGSAFAAPRSNPDLRPYDAPLIIAAVEHQVSALCRFKLGVGTVLPDQQIGSAPDLEVGDHRGVLVSDGRNRFLETLCVSARLTSFADGPVGRGFGEWRQSIKK
jgi:hypothetical protein